MRIHRETFLGLLDKAMVAVNKDGLMSDAFLFMNKSIHSYNCKMVVSIELPFEFITEKFCVKAMELYKLIKKIPDEKIGMELMENKLQIRAKNIKAGLRLLEDNFSDKILSLQETNYEWKDCPNNLYRGIGMCFMPDNLFFFNGVYIKGNEMISINGRMCSLFQLNNTMNEFWLSDDSIKALLKIFRDKIGQYSDGKSWISFRQYNVTFSCEKKCDAYQFDKFKGLFNKYKRKENDIAGTLPDSLNDVLDRASLFSTEKNKALNFILKKDKIECRSLLKNSKYFETIDCINEIIKEPFSININYNYLLYALKRTNDFFIKEKSNYEDDDGKHIIFYTDNYNYNLIMKACTD